jgi:hypothetical protein
MRKPVALRFLGLLVSLLAGCGGGSSTTSSTPSTTVPPPASLSDLSATVSSPQNGTNIACTDQAFVTVVLTNTAHSSVSVSGIRRHQTSGDCTVPDYTYPTIQPYIGTGSAAVMNNEPVFHPYSGCCNRYPCSGFCQVGFSFTVLTRLGDVGAGVITFGVTFNNQCPQCSSTSSLGALSCPTRK